jgi:hypothetical protein
MDKYFSPTVAVELLRVSSTLLFARELSLASMHGSKGYSARGPYGVKMAFVVWRIDVGTKTAGRETGGGYTRDTRRRTELSV